MQPFAKPFMNLEVPLIYYGFHVHMIYGENLNDFFNIILYAGVLWYSDDIEQNQLPTQVVVFFFRIRLAASFNTQ